MNQLTPLRVFDSSLNLITEVANYESAYFQRSWHEVGKFQVSINYSIGQEFQVGRIVLFGNDLKKSGIILEVSDKLNSNGQVKRLVTGVELKYILSRRIVVPPAGQVRYTASTNFENAVKTLVSTQAIAATDSNRNISNLVNATNSNLGPTVLISARYNNLLDVLKGVSKAAGAGFWVELNLTTKKYTFAIGIGLNRTAGQSVNGRAIFSTDYSNLESADLVKSMIKYKNFAYVGGQGEGTARTIQTVPSSSIPTGLNRIESFVDARDLATGGELTQRGTEYLSANGTQDFLSGQALPSSNLVLGVDYDLGDIVTLKALGTSVDARVTAYTENWSGGKYDLKLEFGQQYPTSASVAKENQAETEQIFSATEIA